MFTKNNLLNSWLWKWHVIAGLITLPFMLLLAITGTIYLFKDNLNQQLYQQQMFNQSNPTQLSRLPLSQQLTVAQQAADQKIVAVTLPTAATQNTTFKIAGKGRASQLLYVNPYTAEVKGEVIQQQTLMYTVRKLHGEILLGQAGTLIVELVASWFIVLILTGLYIWWPKQGSGAAGFFTIRFSAGKRVFWRDLHAVIGFWLSAFMLMILAGGMPWTDVFGSQLKWVQQQTQTGFPMHWMQSKGLTSTVAFNSTPPPLNIDTVADIAQQQQLDGVVTIRLPENAVGVYSISNRALLLRDQKVIHIDQYSGEIIKSLSWNEVGVLMDLRQIFMRLHQGEYGLINWLVLLSVALLFSLTTIAGLTSYLLRKPSNNWGFPKVPARFKADKILIIGIIILGAVFPLFGASLILLSLWSYWKSTRKRIA
ncbi:PepSY domain-containing protein [Alteromonadaceae bacterium BrNp21-10]|nr:PepSY domain-containing protein [Alteromonadaceae bacterium BrNp21-10]